MNSLTDRNADYLLHELRFINRFINLKVVLFSKSSLHFISSALNICAIRFSDENVITDNHLFVSRFSTWMNKSFIKTDLKKINCIFFALQIISICKRQWLIKAFEIIEFCSIYVKFIHDCQTMSVISSSRRQSTLDYSVCSLKKLIFT